MQVLLLCLNCFLATAYAISSQLNSSKPFLKSLNSTTGWIIGNGLWNITIGDVYGKKLYYKGQDLIGDAVGHYSGYGMQLHRRS
jgi:rhamnogalacturonan endolyase